VGALGREEMSDQQQWLQSWDAALARWMHEQKRPGLERRSARQWERSEARRFARESSEQRPPLAPWARRVIAR
jgi:hypothetical protein